MINRALLYREELEAAFAQYLREMHYGQNVLYHGTRQFKTIMKDGVLKAAGSGGVSLTRSPDVAAHWASLARDEEAGAGVLVFDRASLATRYRLSPFHDQHWFGDYGGDEMEETIWGRDITDVHHHLVGSIMVSAPRPFCHCPRDLHKALRSGLSGILPSERGRRSPSRGPIGQTKPAAQSEVAESSSASI
jgi:hypothetical protein